GLDRCCAVTGELAVDECKPRLLVLQKPSSERALAARRRGCACAKLIDVPNDARPPRGHQFEPAALRLSGGDLAGATTFGAFHGADSVLAKMVNKRGPGRIFELGKQHPFR